MTHRVAKSAYAIALHEGLSAKQKNIPSRFLYDARGSELFEQITELPEYYPTRTELGILARDAARLAKAAGEGCLLVEFGSGSSRKTELLLDQLQAPAGYVPIDVSPTALAEAAQRLSTRYPTLEIKPLVADFTNEVRLPEGRPHKGVLGFFPGSTIGNFNPPQAEALLKQFHRTLGKGSRLVIGVDLQKGLDVLLPAYDDAAGVTADFNLNLLARANREAEADFDLKAFRHEAIYSTQHNRIEMHLRSLKDQEVRVDGKIYGFRKDETIHTENSYKYALPNFTQMAARAGWHCVEAATDANTLFAVVHLEART